MVVKLVDNICFYVSLNTTIRVFTIIISAHLEERTVTTLPTKILSQRVIRRFKRRFKRRLQWKVRSRVRRRVT